MQRIGLWPGGMRSCRWGVRTPVPHWPSMKAALGGVSKKTNASTTHGTQDLGPRPTGAATAHCGTCASSTTTTATSCRTMCTPWRPAPPLPRSCRPPPRTRSPAGAPHGRAGPGSFYAVDLGLGINLVILNPSVGHDSCRTSGARARMKPFSEWRLEDR
jgi:hypothetical protein